MNFQFFHGNGVGLKFGKQTVLLDPKISDFISFVSHAHGDHSPVDIIKKSYCTEETAEMIKLRNPNFEANTVKKDKKIKFDDFSVKLISAGHILGSTQTLIEVDGKSILYTGDFKLWKGLTCDEIKIQEADVLITEATYGHPNYVLPNIEDVRKDIVKWTNEQMRKGHSVNLGAYSVGKAQEVIKILNENNIVPQVSDTIRKFSEIYKKFDVKLEFLENGEFGDVAVKPMHLLFSDKERKNCVLTGWAAFRNYGCNGIPLSDHCDFAQLIEYIRQVNPKKVYCVHGYERELTKEIKDRLKIPAFTIGNRMQKFLTEF
jgi:Cft2 family RNA processing exonuclease